MKAKSLCLIVALVALVTLAANLAQAEDGVLFRRNISKTPEHETEKAAIYMMDFYVPAQASTGEVKPVANYCLDEDLENPWNENGTCAGQEAYAPRDYAKPLVSVYIDDIGGGEVVPEGMLGIQGGISFGHFDAFVAVSLDDGTSWRNENLSRSSDLSSFTLPRRRTQRRPPGGGRQGPGRLGQQILSERLPALLAGTRRKYRPG